MGTHPSRVPRIGGELWRVIIPVVAMEEVVVVALQELSVIYAVVGTHQRTSMSSFLDGRIPVRTQQAVRVGVLR